MKGCFIRPNSIFKKSINSTIVFFIIFSGNVYSQIYSRPVKHFYKNSASAVQIPFDLNNNRIIMPMKLNDSIDVKVCLDSGWPAKDILFYDPKIKSDRQLGDRADFHFQDLVFPDRSMRFQNIERFQHGPADGILGGLLFSSCIVRVDFDQSQLTLYEPSSFEQGDIGKEIELFFKDKLPHIRTTLTIAGDQEIEVVLLIDLGFPSALMLFDWTTEDIKIPEERYGELKFGGVDFKLTASQCIVESFKLGSFQFSKVYTIFPERPHQTWGGGISNGIVGVEILKRFNIFFDFNSGKMFLEPNSLYDQEFKLLCK